MGVKVLSLFDGMACGMLAMQKAGVEVEEYTAYEIDKYAIQTATHNFPMIKECGDVFKADFTQYKDIDYIVGGSPCVPAGSKVKTDKGYKSIEDVEIGDMVLTHKNRYRPVSRLYKRTSNHLYHITFSGNKTLDITGNHPVYTYRNGQFCFVRTDDLTNDDYVCININNENNYLDYSNDVLWLVGRALADGYLNIEKYAITIAVAKKKINEFESHLCGFHYYVCHKDRPAVEYTIKDDILTELCSYFGNNKSLSKFFPDEIINLPKNQLKMVFDGYISGDGFIRQDKPNTVMWCSSSENLTLSMGLITAKLFNKYPTISVRLPEYKKLPSGYCNTNTNYNSQISITDRANPNIKVIDDKLLIRIKSIKKENISIDVYNIETTEDHSYTVNNCIVHNCTYWSIAQKNNRETEASGLGWELFSQYVRAIREVKPKFFIYENNKSMSNAIRESITKTFGFEPICINSALVSAQNRQRLYWVGKRNADGIYSKVDVKQPEDRGILLKDVLDGVTDREKGRAVIGSTGRTTTREYFIKSQGNMSFEPVGVAQRGRYINNNVTEQIIEAREDNKSNCVTTVGKDSMVAVPVNITDDGKSQTLKAQYYKNSISNFCCYSSTYGATGVAEPVCMRYERSEAAKKCRKQYENGEIHHGFHELSELHPRTDGKTNTLSTVLKDNPICEPVRVGALPRPNGELSTSQAMRVYSTEGKSVNLVSGGGGGMGGKTGLYAIPVEFENDKPIKATSCADGKTYTVYEVRDGLITIKGKQYPIKLIDGYYIIRKLTVSECKRLQTVPEWYEFPVSDTQAYKMLGNGWSVDVIVHLIEATLNS